MTEAQQHITGMVARIRGHWRRQQLAWRGAALLAALLAWLLAMVALDNFAMLAPSQLVAGWGVLLGLLVAWLAWAGYRLTRGQPKAERFAVMYEARVPGQHNRLVNALYFLVTGQIDTDPMARAVVLENAGHLDPRSAGLAINPRPVRDALLAVSVAGVLLLGYLAARPAWVVNGLERLFHPFSPTAHLLATDITVTPGNAQLIEGQSVVIEAKLAHNVPATATLEYRVGNLGWTKASMDASEGGGGGGSGGAAFRYDAFRAVWQEVDYRVRAGRSVSPTYHLALQCRPRVEQSAGTVALPAYAGGTTRPLQPNRGDISALAGSKVTLSIKASSPLSAAQLELADGSKVKMVLDAADRAAATASFALTSSGSYAIRLTDPAGLTNVNPPRYTLTAEPDQPPLAIVARPGRDLVLPANATLDLGIEAEDDIGLAWVAVQVRNPQGQWQELQRWDTKELNIRKHAFATQLSLAAFKLKPNDVLLYRVTAADHRAPEPNVSVGRTWSITAADAAADQSLLAAEAKRLLEALNKVLALQKENRADVDMDRPVAPVYPKQVKVRELSIAIIEDQRKAIRPNHYVAEELVKLADGPMVKANQLVLDYKGTYNQRQPKKQPVLAVMDDIIKKLEELVGKVAAQLALAEKAEKALANLSAAEKDQALKNIRDLLEKLRAFTTDQDKVIADTEELVRKADNFTAADLKKLENLKGMEDKWADVFKGSVQDINKLTEQGFANDKMTSDYKQMVEQIEAASLNLNPKQITMAVPREQSGREMAQELAEDMEMWLPNSPDNLKWVMEEPLDKPEIPMPALPDQLRDMIGDLLEQQEALQEQADDMTSAWADSISAAGWAAMDGPISNFSAQGVTGNQLPNNNEMSGRAGDGRSGKSQGQMVGDTAKGLEGRKTPARVTNDTYEKGVVKELQQMKTGGATGGGKGRGSGQEGLQGQTPPPMFSDMQTMKDWQQRIREKAERVAGQLKSVSLPANDLAKSIELMKKAERAGAEGRYGEMFKVQQMVLQSLRAADSLSAREVSLRVDRALQLPADQRKQILDAADEPTPQEYQDAVRRYFEHLSEDK